MSRKPTGPGRGGDAVEIVSTAMTFQSKTASARAICHQLTAANVMTAAVATLLSNLFERMRDIAFSLGGWGATLRKAASNGRDSPVAICAFAGAVASIAGPGASAAPTATPSSPRSAKVG